MRRYFFAYVLSGAIVVLISCAAKGAHIQTSPQRSGTRPVNIKIMVKRDPMNAAKCVSRTIPKHAELEYGVDDGLIFEIKQAPGVRCLPDGVDLQLKWTGTNGNPTACADLGTHTSRDKKKFECDLDVYRANTKYEFKLYRIGTGMPAGGELIEDPDIEIVQF